MTRQRQEQRQEQQCGSASVLVLACAVAVLLLMLGYATVAAAVEARHRAQVAADTAALSGAMRAAEGDRVACRRAGQLARANGSRLASCTLSDLDLHVEVAVPGTGVLARFGDASATARAGPPQASGELSRPRRKRL